MNHEVRGYLEVRDAAKNFAVYSSDLQGDRDVRDYRQLPLEVDPPRHTLLREAVQPLFLSDAIAPKVPQFEELAQRLIAEISSAGAGDIGRDLALPYVIGCLTIIYNRPQDYDEWLSWGPDVWTAETFAAGAPPVRSGATLQAYLDRVFDQVEANPNPNRETWDVWDYVSAIELEG
jgi:cytochrome P450